MRSYLHMPYANSIGSNKRDILSEHMRLLEAEPEFDGGMTLHVDTNDDHAMHAAEHKRFKAEQPGMSETAKSALDRHIDKHNVFAEEASKLGHDTTAYPDELDKGK